MDEQETIVEAEEKAEDVHDLKYTVIRIMSAGMISISHYLKTERKMSMSCYVHSWLIHPFMNLKSEGSANTNRLHPMKPTKADSGTGEWRYC